MVTIGNAFQHTDGDKKMAAMLQATFSSTFFSLKITVFWIKFQWIFTIDNKPSLVQVMAWHQTGDKALYSYWHI